jgi:acetyl esterase/lipase
MEDRSVLSRSMPEPQQLRYGPDPDQVADVYSGSADLPLVFLIHGGYWRPEYDRAHLRPLAHAIAQTGASVCSIEYRRIPGNPDATVSDVDRALRSTWDAIPHSGRIAIGHSAGGHLLLYALAHGVPLDAAIALAPIADLRRADELALDDGAVQDFCGGQSAFDPMDLAVPTTPLTIVHGDGDERVPLELSAHYAERFGTLEVITGVGHFELIDPAHAAGQYVISLAQRHFDAADSRE